MSDRYWVGGDGTWDSTSTLNWSTTSGGAPGASAPTISDNVFFDGGSSLLNAPFTVTISNASCHDMQIDDVGVDIDVTFEGNDSLEVNGSVQTNTSFIIWDFTGTITFTASTLVNVFFIEFAGPLIFNGTGTWECGVGLTNYSNDITLLEGRLNLSGYDGISCANFTSSGSQVRVLDLGSTVNYISGNWIITGSNFSLVDSNFDIEMSGVNPAFIGGTGNYKGVIVNTSTIRFVGSNHIYQLLVGNDSSPVNIRIAAGSTLYLTNGILLSSPSNLSNPVTIRSTIAGLHATISQSESINTDLSNVILIDNYATGGASFIALLSNHNIDGGGNSGWVFDSAPAYDQLNLPYAVKSFLTRGRF